ncbi:MAG: hypothetical protein K9K33_18820 [Desulfarculaceae bacterium]|nr:hypothetical protein [Desulfarculaceae bacterium]
MARKKNSEELEQLRGCIEYLGSQLETEQVQSNPRLREDIQELLNDNYRQYFQLSTGQVGERSTSNSSAGSA